MLLSAEGVEKAWGDRHILRGIDLVVQPGEVVGLVGANGCGKSTLLAILSGEVEPDHGIVRRPAAAGVLEQDPRLPAGTVRDAAAGALHWHRALLTDWERAVADGDEAAMSSLQARLDSVGWDLGHTVSAVLDRLRAPPGEQDVSTLSGGERRRVALARALLSSPDLLLLDEPTNHLDAETVAWLEGFIGAFRGGVVLVTHDRYLLESVATRIVEVEDGVAVGYDWSYADYLVERAERQARQARADQSRLMLIQREAEWASRSPAAQTKKQKARLDRLAALQSLGGARKEESFQFDLTSGARFGRTLLEARGLKKSFDRRPILRGLDLDIAPGDRIGVVGPNGVGKSTLLGLLTGGLMPDAGTVQRQPRLKVAMLDQGRTGLPSSGTVFEAAGKGNDSVTLDGRIVRVEGFLRRFLFPREMLDQPVTALSGGERARLLLARLMLEGGHLLLLDEPTNDLDLTTLRVLEEALLAFDGAAIVVTHDRAFLDRVCTAVLAFHGEGRVVRYASRQQWLAALSAEEREAGDAPPAMSPRSASTGAAPPAATPGAATRTRLSWKEAQELAALPARIDALDAEKASLEARLSDPATWKGGDGAALGRRATELEAQLAALMTRWEELAARE